MKKGEKGEKKGEKGRKREKKGGEKGEEKKGSVGNLGPMQLVGTLWVITSGDAPQRGSAQVTTGARTPPRTLINTSGVDRN